MMNILQPRVWIWLTNQKKTPNEILATAGKLYQNVKRARERVRARARAGNGGGGREGDCCRLPLQR